MIAYCPSDDELAATLHVSPSCLAVVLDEVAADLAVWATQDQGWLQPTEQAVACAVLPTGGRSMALAFPDPSDLQRYLPDALLPTLDVVALSFRELLAMLLNRPSLDLVILKPQVGELSSATLYVGIQIERARLIAAVLQRALLENTGTGLLLASFLKWMNEHHPDADRLLVASVLAHAALDERLLSISQLARTCGIDSIAALRASGESASLFAAWWANNLQ